jgi:hypothetical protein
MIVCWEPAIPDRRRSSGASCWLTVRDLFAGAVWSPGALKACLNCAEKPAVCRGSDQLAGWGVTNCSALRPWATNSQEDGERMKWSWT